MKLLFKINIFLTIYLNIKNLPIGKALKFPILIFGRVSLINLKGKFVLSGDCPVKTGIIRIGETGVGIFERRIKSVFDISGPIIFHGRTRIGKGSSLSVAKDSELILGDNFKITGKSAIVASGGKKVEFGANCLLSWDILIINNDFHKISTLDDGKWVNEPRDIVIMDNVWVGCRTTILKGSIIPSNSIIAANSVISSKLTSEYSIYGGIPAMHLKGNVTWER